MRGSPTHGMSKTHIYKLWNSMRQRCDNPNVRLYEHYGGRGIKVCRRWEKFENFFADMGLPPIGHSLERKNNDRGYSKANCVWAPRHVQNNNTSRTIRITYQGRTQSAKQWASELGMKYPTVLGRIKSGWDPIVAITKPSNTYVKSGKYVGRGY